jgi:RNA polymerase sigma-70 factor, ECF subfamily
MSVDRSVSEEEIQAALSARDHERAAVLTLRRYGDELLGYLVAQLRDVEQAREVFSVFAEDLWQALPQLALRTTMRAYCYALARNAARRYLDRDLRKQRRGVPLSAAAVMSGLQLPERTRTAPFALTENRDRIAALRERLDAEERELLTLRVDRGLSWSEIAETLAGPGEDLTRVAARLRKRFQLVKEKLAVWAREAGIVGQE